MSDLDRQAGGIHDAVCPGCGCYRDRCACDLREEMAVLPPGECGFGSSFESIEYPCGCKAAGNSPLPTYCPEHGSQSSGEAKP
jgi:hypothetical protein